MGQGTAVLQSGASFRDFVSVNVSNSAVTLLRVSVYRGQSLPGNLVYTKSIIV